MKLNKKKWFKENVLEFSAVYRIAPDAKEGLMYYTKYGKLGGEVNYNFYRGLWVWLKLLQENCQI